MTWLGACATAVSLLLRLLRLLRPPEVPAGQLKCSRFGGQLEWLWLAGAAARVGRAPAPGDKLLQCSGR